MTDTGRPPKYKTKEEMQEAIDNYFNDLPSYEVIVGAEILQVRKPTITGLAYALGFCSRASMYEYESKEEFSDTIKRARLRIENDYEMQLRTANTGHAGIIFGLKNLGWSDKQEIDHKSSDGTMSPKNVDAKTVKGLIDKLLD